MHSSVWLPQGRTARLRAASLAGQLDLALPGLNEVSIGPVPLGPACLLQVDLPGHGELAPSEAYARGCDLVATYAETPDRPFRVQVYWRAESGDPPSVVASTPIAAVELIVSVQTNLLDDHPQLTVGSDLTAAEVWHLPEPRSAEFERLPLTQMSTFEFDRRHSAGCFIVRLPGSELSYAEMVHPLDFRQTQIVASSQCEAITNPVAVRIRHRLFERGLEKGVILRSRVRGVFFPRAGDLASTAEHYAAWCEAPPPLTT